MVDEDPDQQVIWISQCVANASEAIRRGVGLDDLVTSLRGTAPRKCDDKINEPPEAWLWWAYCCRNDYAYWGGKDADRAVLALLWQRSDISEGQGAKALGINRIAFREICDGFGLSQYVN